MIAATAVVLAVPASSAPPSISGSAVAGQVLTELHGTWSNGPTAFTYQWEHCESTGSQCLAIAGAGGQTYSLGAGDVGSTIRVVDGLAARHLRLGARRKCALLSLKVVRHALTG